MSKFLDKAGLATLVSKVKALIESKTSLFVQAIGSSNSSRAVVNVNKPYMILNYYLVDPEKYNLYI